MTLPTMDSVAPQHSATLTSLLSLAVSQGASDLHFRSGGPPLLRISGQLVPVDLPPLTEAECERITADCLARERDRAEFRDHQEVDFALVVPGIGRFRGNAYRARGSAAVVLRHVREHIPTADELGLPSVFEQFSNATDGLVLVAGPTGSGKSTTLACMIDAINHRRRCHILTIEDPIEYLHVDHLATVSQREIHTDTVDFPTALRSGMRQDPDIILVGEIRDLETIRTALQAAETGHLVLASVHAKSAVDAVNRVIDFFSVDEQRQARLSLADSLRGVMCQRLLPIAGESGRIPAIEVLVNTARVREAIADPAKFLDLSDIIEDGKYYGMHSFEQDLVRLVLAGRVSVEDALSVSSSASDFTVALKRAGYMGTDI